MRKAAILGAALALALGSPAAAQDADPAQANEDLQCIVWAGIVGAMVEETNPESARAFQLAVVYFAGHYEATSGQPIAGAMDRELVLAVAQDPDAFTNVCGQRMAQMGEGLQVLGREMTPLKE